MTQINNTNAVEAAKSKIETIRQAIIGGDKKLTANDLSAARSELEFAELQESAKEIAASLAVDEARRSNLLDLQKQLRVVSESAVVVEKKFAAFEKNLTDYLSSVVVYQKDLRSVSDELANGGFLPGYTPGPIADVPATVGRNVEIGEVVAGHIEPKERIKTLVDRRLGEFGEDLRRK